jgi:hypothetical protein
LETSALREEDKLWVFENTRMMRINGPNKEATGMQVAGMGGMRNTYKTVAGNSKGRRPRCMWEVDIKLDSGL